jgi:hypothetical protein
MADSTIGPGDVAFATLYFTSLNVPGQFSLMPPPNGAAPHLVGPDGGYLSPVVTEGLITVGGATGVDDTESLTVPEKVQLAQNYPNPFNSETVIDFALPSRANVTLELFNILGQRVRLLTSGALAAGDHRIEWDGNYDSGRPAPTGIYFYRLQAGSVSAVRKMILIK